MSIFKGKGRVEMLGFDIIHLISSGFTESFDDIISHFEQSNLLPYLHEKYKDYLNILTYGVNSPYDFDEWEKVLDEYSYMTYHHDAVRKWGITKKDDGLLLLLGIILELASNQ